ncbi:MAG TPA: FAD-dependent oxidoreductase, partial [Alphaproteobacteria bacterium]|nr:FAD-dependent oxidoreductase [Alphaproteobacteria bacterium]
MSSSSGEGYVPYLVIGAGVSGLSAALALLDKGVPGHDIAIIDAQDHAGGRVNSIALASGIVAERGASWYHLDDFGHNPFMEFILARYGAGLAHIIPENQTPCLALTDKGPQTIPYFDDDIDNRLRDEFHKFHAANPKSDISLLGLARRIKDKDRGRAMIHIRRLAENYMGSAHENQSSASEVFTDPYGDGGPQVWEGLETGIRAMEAELRSRGVAMHLNTQIETMAEGPDGAVLTDAKGVQHEAGRVICTLPVPVLKTMAARSKDVMGLGLRQYLKSIQISHFTKLIVPMEEGWIAQRFAPDSAVINTVGEDFTEISIRPASKPLAILFATGERAVAWERMDKARLMDVVNIAFAQIPAMEGFEKAVLADEISVTDWNTNPLFR